MKALEFTSKVKNNQIEIPDNIQSELQTDQGIKVIVLFKESDDRNYTTSEDLVREQFFKGYSNSDAIYDNY